MGAQQPVPNSLFVGGAPILLSGLFLCNFLHYIFTTQSNTSSPVLDLLIGPADDFDISASCDHTFGGMYDWDV